MGQRWGVWGEDLYAWERRAEVCGWGRRAEVCGWGRGAEVGAWGAEVCAWRFEGRSLPLL